MLGWLPRCRGPPPEVSCKNEEMEEDKLEEEQEEKKQEPENKEQ